MSGKLLVLGGGGHAQVVMETMISLAWQERIVGILDADPDHVPENPFAIPVLGTDAELEHFPPESTQLVNGLGAVGKDHHRERLFLRLQKQGYQFPSLVHPDAVVARGVRVGAGAQIMAGAVVQVGSVVGENAIVNTGAVVDHDGAVGAHAHVGPGAVLCGGVTVDEGALVGAGATVIQGVHVGHHAVVGAGAVVVRNVANGARMAGVPARELPE
ncbi:MAG: NeuD/PglB/VioB family sugar acetyltransferase [Magnetococcales bacterium]|nr:NeuD/PglB/VioB family sugar acetyltransferase [Magnetococcales bacterium]